MPDNDRRAEPQPAPQGRKPYAQPTLTEYGSVAKLTMAKGTTQVEISPNKRRKCL